MKRSKILVCALACMAFLLTGCSQKESKLVCTQTTSGVDIEFNVGFKGKMLESMDFNYNMDLSKYSDTQIKAIEKQDFCSVVKGYMSTYKDAFANCNQEVTDKKLKVSSEFDVNKLTKNVLDRMGSAEATKKDLEGQGYTCTLK